VLHRPKGKDPIKDPMMNGPDGATRPLHVLIEHEDVERRHELMQQFLDRGFDVSACGGPHALDDDTCPLVIAGGCPLVAAADIVFFDLDLDDRNEAAVYHAIRQQYPDLPIVLEMPLAAARRHHDDLIGATVVPPFDTDHLVQVVDDAVCRVA